MDILILSDLKMLVAQSTGPCVSLYMPSHRAGPETQQDPILFKNLLARAEEGLIAHGLRSPKARELLAPARELLHEPAFWREQSDGLAVFLAADVFHFYRLPLRFAEHLVVAERFHIKPLLPLFVGDGHFFVLALSQNQVRLLEGTPRSVDEIDLEGVPGSLAEAVKVDDLRRHLQFHTRTTGGSGDRPAALHGHDPADEAKERILRFFHRLDEGLREVLRDERAPLVLAGVEYLFPLYREANTYPHLLDEGLAGNPEELNSSELHEMAWALVQPHFLQAQQEAAARYAQLAGTGRTSNEIEEVVGAAYHGRIDVLFAAVGTHQWGRFDAQSGEVEMREEPEPGDEDLVDLASVHTLMSGGAVYAVPHEDMPDSTPVAAIFRY